MDVLDAFSIFNVEEFPPNRDSQQFIVFGNDEIATLKSHFGTSEEVVEQWDNFRFEMLRLRKKWFVFKDQLKSNKIKLCSTATEWSLKQIVNSFNENPD